MTTPQTTQDDNAVATVQLRQNRYSPSEAEAETAFRAAYPAFAETTILDELRATEYARLDRAGHIYLDYTGGGLYAESQVKAHMDLLLGGIFGNPHSTNPTSMAMTQLVSQARASVFDFFSASPDEYDVIFTLNASGALKLVGESYPFGPGDSYLLTFDNHNSVNGIREFARVQSRAGEAAPSLVRWGHRRGCLGTGRPVLSACGGEAFEDGTLNYLALLAVTIGLRHIAGIGLETIHTRVTCLTGWLLDALCALHHSNGTPLIHIYGPVETYARGGTVTLNLNDPDGQYVDLQVVEERANRANISLRTSL